MKFAGNRVKYYFMLIISNLALWITIIATYLKFIMMVMRLLRNVLPTLNLCKSLVQNGGAPCAYTAGAKTGLTILEILSPDTTK